MLAFIFPNSERPPISESSSEPDRQPPPGSEKITKIALAVLGIAFLTGIGIFAYKRLTANIPNAESIPSNKINHIRGKIRTTITSS